MLRTCVFILCAGLMHPLYAAESSAVNPNENLFEKGLAAYQNKQYGEARDLFQKLIEEKRGSAPVLHNLALSYFQLDQAPMSLALWRKALTIDPGFRPAHAGRDFAEMKLQSRGFERDRFSALAQRNLEFISFFDSLWVVALVLAITGGLWIRYWADRRHALDEESPLPPFPVTAVILSVVLVCCVGLLVMKLNDSLKERATIITKKASAMSLPGDGGVGLFDLNGGAEVLVRRRDKDWSQVQNGDGASGWVRNADMLVTSSGLSAQR